MSYRDEVLRTAKRQWDVMPQMHQELTNAALGLTGEAGEVADVIKKHVIHGAPLERDKLIKEAGDVRWYLELLTACLGVSMEEVERLNVEKLRKRYPEGFSTQASIERKDTK